MERKKIFVASSVSEDFIKQLRVGICDFCRQISNTIIDNGTFVECNLCEDMSDAVAEYGTQTSTIDKEMRDSNLILVVFKNKYGKYTFGELKTALEHINENKYKIKVFFSLDTIPQDEESAQVKKEIEELLNNKISIIQYKNIKDIYCEILDYLCEQDENYEYREKLSNIRELL